MTVFVVYQCVRNGREVLGVFSSKEGAKQYLKDLRIAIYHHVGYTQMIADNELYRLPHDFWNLFDKPVETVDIHDEVTGSAVVGLEKRECRYVFCDPNGFPILDEIGFYIKDHVVDELVGKDAKNVWHGDGQ